MWRFVLGVLGALVLWSAACWAGTAAAATPHDAPPTAKLTPLRLSGWKAVPLAGRSIGWVDRAARYDVKDMESAAASLPWRVRQADQVNHMHGGALWLQFEAAVPAGERWYLELGSAIHNDIALYYRDHGGNWVVQEAGLSVPVRQWPVPGRLPTFALSTDGSGPVRYWLRVQDDRADFGAPAVLLRHDALQDSRETEQFLFGGYAGIALLVILAAFANGILFRDRPFVAFGLYTLLLASGQLARAGVGAQHLWQEWPVLNTAALGLWPGAAAAAGLWFVKTVTEPVRVSRALDLSVWALIAALLAAVAVDVTISTSLSQRLVLALTGFSLVALASMLVWGWIDGRDRPMRLIALGCVPVLAIGLFPLARSFNLVGASVLTRSALFFATIVQMPLLYYGLHMRLMARREGELRAGALSRTDALTGLPHRRGLVERLDSSLARARGQKQNCALLGVRISNLEAIADEFGRDAAEKALVVAASHLRRTSVDFDMAARVGEREFAVLMEAPVTPQQVISRAQHVVASGLRQVEALPAALTLKFHVTAAILPLELDGEGTLEWVTAGLDQITQDARKLIKVLNF